MVSFWKRLHWFSIDISKNYHIGSAVDRMTTSVSSEAQKLWIDNGKKVTIECHTINIKDDKIGNTGKITQSLKSRKLKNLKKQCSTAINGQILIKLNGNM